MYYIQLSNATCLKVSMFVEQLPQCHCKCMTFQTNNYFQCADFLFLLLVMAVALHGRRVTSRILSYMQSLKTIQASAVQLQRTYSEFENNGFGEVMFNQEESATVWPDDLMGPLSPQDKRFPLPGNIGVTPLGLSKPQR